ncbi:hypothetical protein GQ54DRAFT_317918 [Martensiomyces pterosporus]|nr:hypothetical protein GQ54DRAFT_317918 [Martensiomyces pterosporus]
MLAPAIRWTTNACISRFYPLCRLRDKQRRRYVHKELASIPDIAWRSGQRKQQQQQQQQQQVALPGKHGMRQDELSGAAKRVEHKGPLFGNYHAVYSRKERGKKTMPRFVPAGSDMYRALTEMAQTRRGLRFNPWTILLELLDDTRLECSVNNNKLLVAMGHLGWVTPDNIMAQRPLFAKYLLNSSCLSALPQFSTLLPSGTMPKEEARARFSGVDLTPSELMVLCQMQWPRFVAQKYQQALSVPALELVPIEHGRARRIADWSRAWLSTNLCVLELRTALKRRRTLFNDKMDDRERCQLLFRSAFEHAPGFALNLLMSWGGEYSQILNPYSIGRLSETYFADVDTTRQVIGQAWQMYDWLIYCNPQGKLPADLDPDVPAGKRKSVQFTRSASAHIFQALRAFDNWEEATRSLNCLYRSLQQESQELSASDRRLTERYLRLQPLHGNNGNSMKEQPS